ncbi:PIR protein [Plasmodium vivax]|nr:PIR protein [Plasmodium vivax]
MFFDYFQEKSALALKLNTLYEALFPKNEKSKFDEQCKLLDTHNKTYVGVRELCSKFARALEKAAEVKGNGEERKNSCNYLHYWLYDEIGRIKTVDRSKKMDSIPFFKDLIDAVNKVNEQIKVGKCTLKFDKNVTLDELIKRNISYIYFKKYNDIKGNIKPEKKDECSKYFTYLTNFKSLYDKLKNDHCKYSFWSFSSSVPDYFNCTQSFDPKDLLSKADACKSKGSGGSGGSIWGIIFGGSSSGTSGTRSTAVSKETPRASGSEAKITGGAKNPSLDGPPKDKAAKEVTKATVAEDRSKGLTSSTSYVTVGSSPRPAAEATVRNSAVAGKGLPSQSANLQPRVTLSSPVGGSPVQNALAAAPATLQIRDSTVPVPIVDSPNPLESATDKVDTNFYRNIIMAAAILGTIFFLFYYNMSSGLKSRCPKRKRKKKIFEHNYYEEYEKGLAKYESEYEFLDPQSDRYYLNYQPERDYDY